MITVSVCMIVKNEEKVLARCLDSLVSVADEIVIVDTGSTDDTKAIARKYTDKIYDFQWVDDFSAARNFAFSKCNMEYIYSADADELLDEVNQKKFQQMKEMLLPEIEIVQMWYVNKHEHTTTENYIKDYRPKLFKRVRNFTWIEPVHETVNLNPVVFDSDLEVFHMPTSSHSERDFRTFQKALKANGKLSSRLHKMYAMELMLSGKQKDFAEAKDYFEMSLNDPSMSQQENEQSYAVLARCHRLNGDVSGFFKYALKNIVTAPSSEICMEIGNYYEDNDDIDEAIVWYINASNETKPVLDAQSGNIKSFIALSRCYDLLAERIREFDEDLADDMKAQALEYKKQAENTILY